MAEERLIDDDKDRKYKIRINEDGEEELVIDDTAEEDEEADIPVFEVPVYDEDDEEAAVLTPEQLAERERIKREEEAARAEKVSALCAKARQRIEEGDFEAAKYVLSQAEEISTESGEVYYLKLKTLTRNMTEFTSLEECAEAADGVKEYSDASCKADLKALSSGLEKLIAQTQQATDALAEENQSKKEERREAFLQQKKTTLMGLLLTAIPFAVLLIMTIVFGSMMFSKENGSFIVATIVSGALAFISLICTLVAANKFWSADKKVRLNERDSSTKLGREYLETKTHLDLLKRIYTALDDDLS